MIAACWNENNDTQHVFHWGKSREKFLDGQWHYIAAFNYHRSPKERADATMTTAGRRILTALLSESNMTLQEQYNQKV